MQPPRKQLVLLGTITALVLGSGCGQAPPNQPTPVMTPPSTAAEATVLLSVTSDAQADPQAVDMALKLAGFSLDEGRSVVMFFNVKGVLFPTTGFPADFAFGENDSLITQLNSLIERGVDVHVCPICMKALEVDQSDLISGAKVTTRASLFAHIGADTAVFTY